MVGADGSTELWWPPLKGETFYLYLFLTGSRFEGCRGLLGRERLCRGRYQLHPGGLAQMLRILVLRQRWGQAQVDRTDGLRAKVVTEGVRTSGSGRHLLSGLDTHFNR